MAQVSAQLLNGMAELTMSQQMIAEQKVKVVPQQEAINL